MIITRICGVANQIEGHLAELASNVRDDTGRRLAMDGVDRQLVGALRENGRASWAELGRLVGMSGPSVQERVRRLEEQGVIIGYQAVVSAPALGLSVSALVDLYQGDDVDGD